MGLKFKTPKADQQPQKRPSPVTRNVAKWQWNGLVLILVSPLIFIGIKFFMSLWFVSASGVVTFETMQIKAPADGYIKNVFFEKSDSVKANTLLIKFHSPVINKRFQLLKQELTTLQHRKQQMSNQQQAILEQMKQQAKTNLNKNRTFYERFQKYQEKNIISEMQLKDAWNDVYKALEELLDIKRRLKANQQAHQLEIEKQYNKRIRQIKIELAKLESLKRQFNIKVKQPATVKQVLIYPGEYVTQGQKLMNLVMHSPLRVRAYIAPKYASQVYKGKKVTINLPNGTEIKARVSENPNLIGRKGNNQSLLKQQSNQIVFFVKPQRKMPDKFQTHGMPVKIDIGNVWGWDWDYFAQFIPY